MPRRTQSTPWHSHAKKSPFFWTFESWGSADSFQHARFTKRIKWKVSTLPTCPFRHLFCHGRHDFLLVDSSSNSATGILSRAIQNIPRTRTTAESPSEAAKQLTSNADRKRRSSEAVHVSLGGNKQWRLSLTKRNYSPPGQTATMYSLAQGVDIIPRNPLTLASHLIPLAQATTP